MAIEIPTHAGIALDGSSPAEFQPVEVGRRIALVDSIRGLAVFGILWVNVFLRSDPLQLGALSQDRDALSWVVALTGTLKFRSMFAFLFGVALALQAERAPEDRVFVRAYLRRLSILLLFGVLHLALLWPGDILAMYAVAGMLLVCFRKASAKVLLSVGLGLLVVSMVQQVAGIHLFDPASLRADVASGYQVYRHGSFWEVTERRVLDYVVFWAPSLWMTFPGVFAMMLFGLSFQRREAFRLAEMQPGLWRKLCWGGYLVGVPANAVFATWSVSASRSTSFTVVAKLAHAIGAPVLCIAYVATLVLLFRTDIGRRALGALEAVGKMSLTMYLGHSIVCSTLFYGYGLGWFGRVGKWQDVAICFGLFLAELVFANVWVRYFKMGPLEWIWRWGTYRSRPALRHPQPYAGADGAVSA